ncbi:MAG: hypothetical protein R3C05_02870 [Pirellulaceae bacterium]
MITAQDDAVVDGNQLVRITASASGFVDAEESILITDDEASTLTVTIDKSSLDEDGGTATGTVRRNANTSEALIADLSSSDLGEANVPASVTIPAGSDSATFTITGVDDSIVDGTQSVIITASADTFINGTAGIDVADDDVPTLTLSIDVGSISENGGTA